MSIIKKIINRIFYNQISPLIKLGLKKPLVESDIPEAPNVYHPNNIDPEISKINQKSIFRFILGIAGKIKLQMLLAYGFLMGVTVFGVLETHFFTLLLEKISKFTESENIFITGLIYIVGFSLASMMVSLSVQYFIHAIISCEQRVINFLNDLIYKKSLKLSNESRNKNTIGDIVNLMGTDSDKFAQTYSFISELFHTVFCTIGVFGYAYFIVGNSIFYGLLVLLILSPLAYFSSKKFVELDHKLMSFRDKRVSLMSQILSGIRVVKYFTWENRLSKDVQSVRNKELKERKKLVIVKVLSTLIWSGVSIIVSFTILSAYYFSGNELTASIVFPMISLFSYLTHPYCGLGHHISEVCSGIVSGRRVLKFLNNDIKSQIKTVSKDNSTYPIKIDRIQLDYGNDKKIFDNFSVELKKNESVAIVGKVGAGKSTLINAVLGELPLASGNISIECTAKIGFAGQESFIQSGTLKDNILFGSNNTDCLESIIENCGLSEDINQFPDGLLTEIGENGVNLSGGQKQRLSLARVCLRNPDIILLDDPLSAVDPDMEEHLVKNLLLDKWVNKTILMATHRLKYLRCFDKIIYLSDNGYQIDSYESLYSSNLSFRQLLDSSDKSEKENYKKKIKKDLLVSKNNQKKESVKAIEDEDKETGSVDYQVYRRYFKAMCEGKSHRKKWILFSLLFSSLLAVLFPIIHNYWISLFIKSGNSGITLNFFGGLELSQDWFMKGYIGIGVLAIVSYGLENYLWSIRTLKAGKYIHDTSFRRVLKSPVRFFDKNPVGRILNRFSRDVDVLESNMAETMEDIFFTFINSLCCLLVIVAVLPIAILIVAPLLVIFYSLQQSYRSTARELKRLYSITRSPRYTHFKETLEGIATIRAFDKEKHFYSLHNQYLYRNQKMLYTIIVANRWFCVRIPIIGVIFTLTVSSYVLYLASIKSISPSTSGLALVYTINFWLYVNWFTRTFSEAESQMTSVERLLSYTDLETEKSVATNPIKNPEKWAEQLSGAIQFNDVWVRYEEKLDWVLKGVSFLVEPGQRVGIIGRTGAGKSTIFSSLYRFLSCGKGSILIDGSDIAGIPLKVLRNSIAIIPQDPTLFMGTLRENLDRFQNYSDTMIWSALEKVQMSDFVKSLDSQLNCEVLENGKNFSTGERQLLCMARAILLDSKIIILDEATASVDLKTDEIIQNTIRTQFRNKTLLIIAHRINTVSDCDQIIKLKDGKVSDIRFKNKIITSQIKETTRIKEKNQEKVEPAYFS